MLERPWYRRKRFAGRAIPAVQHSARRAAMRTSAFVLDPSTSFLAGHSRAKIWQMKPRPRNRHGNPVARIKAEEPHSRFTIGDDVGTYIQFRKSREPGNRRCAAQAHARHSKWHNSEPCLPFIGIDLQLRRDMPSKCRFLHAPVRKKQIVPTLRHNPGAPRQGPRPVVDVLQVCDHWNSLVSLDIAIAPIYPSLSLTNRILSIQTKRKLQKERHHATQSIGGMARRLERRQRLDFHG